MEQVTITLHGAGIQDTQNLNIQVSIAATVNIDAKTARRQATVWLVSEVGNMLVGGAPYLLIGHKTVWCVPAILTSAVMGTVGEVGLVEVDAENGKLLVTDNLKTQILENVEQLTRSAPAPTG